MSRVFLSRALAATAAPAAAAWLALSNSHDYAQRSALHGDQAAAACDTLEPSSGHALCRRWDDEEAHPNFELKPHILLDTCTTWSPRDRPPRAALPGLRKVAIEQCGSVSLKDNSSSACHKALFSLAVALLDSTTFGYMTDAEVQERRESPEQRREFRRQGAHLTRRLAEIGMPEGLCGWAFCMLSEEPIDDVRFDPPAAVRCHLQAAVRGCTQSMHELGVIYYTGQWSEEGVPEDAAAAMRWLRHAAEEGVPTSMYLLGEGLLHGHGGTRIDRREAYRWLVEAGERGHVGARMRVRELVRELVREPVVVEACAEDTAARQQRRAG